MQTPSVRRRLLTWLLCIAVLFSAAVGQAFHGCCGDEGEAAADSAASLAAPDTPASAGDSGPAASNAPCACSYCNAGFGVTPTAAPRAPLPSHRGAPPARGAHLSSFQAEIFRPPLA